MLGQSATQNRHANSRVNQIKRDLLTKTKSSRQDGRNVGLATPGVFDKRSRAAATEGARNTGPLRRDEKMAPEIKAHIFVCDSQSGHACASVPEVPPRRIRGWPRMRPQRVGADEETNKNKGKLSTTRRRGSTPISYFLFSFSYQSKQCAKRKSIDLHYITE